MPLQVFICLRSFIIIYNLLYFKLNHSFYKFRIFIRRLDFDCLQKANREFIASLLALFRNSRRAVEMHEDLSQSTQPPAELLKGCFDGLKVTISIFISYIIFFVYRLLQHRIYVVGKEKNKNSWCIGP